MGSEQLGNPGREDDELNLQTGTRIPAWISKVLNPSVARTYRDITAPPKAQCPCRLKKVSSSMSLRITKGVRRGRGAHAKLNRAGIKRGSGPKRTM